jgi:hypothetical protein
MNEIGGLQLSPISVCTNPCGGVDVYVVKMPLRTRLHHLVHRLQHKQKFQSITSWEDVWSACAGWHEKGASQKLRGQVKRGILYHDSNSCFAFVEFKHQLYMIRGIWG